MKYRIAILLMLASFNSYAGLTKWVDSNGVVHYSDAPPPGNVKSETLQLRSSDQGGMSAASAPASAPSRAKSIYEMESDINKERQAREEAAKKAAQKDQETKERQRACEQARAQLNTLQNAPRIVTYDENGNPTFIGDEGRQERIRSAQDSVSEYCQ